MRVNIEAKQFKVDQKLVQFIERKLAKLGNFFDRIIDAQVILKLENSGQVKDKIVEVKLNVPGSTLFVRELHKSFEGSTEYAVDNLKRQLKKYKEKKAPKRA